MTRLTWLDEFDGGFIYAPWAKYEDTVKWYQTNFELRSTFNEKYPNEQMTSLAFPAIGQMHIKSVRSEFGHFQVDWGRHGTSRFCFEAPNVQRTHQIFKDNGLKLTPLYNDPYGFTAFDVFDLNGTRLTIQSPHPDYPDFALKVPDARLAAMAPPRYTVPNLAQALEWYKAVLGIRELEMDSENAVALVQFGAGDGCPSVLEESKGAEFVNVHEAARAYFVIRDRQKFYDFHSYLKNKEIVVTEIAGHEQGLQLFHFFDPYGNQINVWVYPC